MKVLLIVMFESFVLTVFITLMSQMYLPKGSSLNCQRGGYMKFNKCTPGEEALR